jgi:TonB family protein
VLEIERDLERWRPGKWFWIGGLLFCAQVGGLWVTARVPPRRTIYPAEPKIRLVSTDNFFSRSPRNAMGAEWLALEDPMLYAAPRFHGFSGTAWMDEDPLPSPISTDLPEPDYLDMNEVRLVSIDAPLLREPAAASIIPNPAPEPSLADEPPSASAPGDSRVSRVSIAGFDNMRLAAPVAAPIQYWNDAVSPTVVEAVVIPDGMVVSARVLKSSGSKRADSDALTLARTARFESKNNPPGARQESVEIGKLIFDWYALNLSQTNAVKR